MGKEEEELNHIWELFKDQPEEIRAKRQQVTSILNENPLSSFPKSISILTAFDELFECFSIGGQIRNYYRYGSLDSCIDQREKFWFAMKHGNLYGETKITEDSDVKQIDNANKVQEFFKTRLIKMKATGSSEDIWDARSKPLNNPFKE